MPIPIINIADVTFYPPAPQFEPSGDASERFGAKTGAIGQLIGSQKLGYNITAVSPGKRAWPYHNHCVKEEMFYILSGNGEVRIGGATYAIRSGDFIACPAGGKQTAHQIINTGTEELRYLAVSTQSSAEMVEYPDSGKFAVSGQFAAAPGEEARELTFVGRGEQSQQFWEGE